MTLIGVMASEGPNWRVRPGGIPEALPRGRRQLQKPGQKGERRRFPDGVDWEAMRKQEAGGTPLCRDGAGWVEADLSLLALRAAGRCSRGWGCVVGDDLQWLQNATE